MQTPTAAQFEGRVIEIRGAVIDLAFDGGLPPIEDAVEIMDADGRVIVAEIQAHLDARSRARDCARADDGLEARRRRALSARRTGHDRRRGGDARAPTRRARARRRPRAAAAGRRAALADPPQAAAALGADRRDQAVRHRHQGDRPARPARAGRQGGDVRRRRRRQDRAGDGAHPRDGRELSGHFGLRRRRRALARRPRDAARHDGIGRSRAHRARLRADERAARRALARADDRDDDRRIFPRRSAVATCCC